MLYALGPTHVAYVDQAVNSFLDFHKSAELGESWEEVGIKQKIRQWYWCGVLGELYGGAVESRHARDLPECLSWIREGGPLPATVRVASFNPDRLLTLRTRNNAACK